MAVVVRALGGPGPPLFTLADMTIQRMDNVAIVVCAPQAVEDRAVGIQRPRGACGAELFADVPANERRRAVTGIHPLAVAEFRGTVITTGEWSLGTTPHKVAPPSMKAA